MSSVGFELCEVLYHCFDRRGSGEDGKLGMGDWEEDYAHRIQFLEPKNVVAVVAVVGTPSQSAATAKSLLSSPAP